MDEPMICKVIATGSGAKYESVRVFGSTLEKQIYDDQAFGFYEPNDDGVLYWAVKNGDGEITDRNIRRAIAHAFFRWSLHVPIKFKRAREGQAPDITFEFRKTAEDSILNAGTLAYMYYPLGNGRHSVRGGKPTDGICVINSDYYWTRDGKGIDMHYIDPIHYPELGSGVKGATWDLDQVLGHEIGHGVFGLPHSQNDDKIMSPNYGIMFEYATEEDVLRAQAKAGEREILSRHKEKLLAWLKVRSEG